MSSKMTYEKAGVDILKAKEAHERIGRLIASTFNLRKGRFGELLNEFGHYAALLDISPTTAIALHADGVGTKVLIAQMLDKYDTIGIDCVAMNVNDLICCGAEPVALIDYIALETSNPLLAEDLVRGLVKGAKSAGAAIVGGETAIMPDVIKGVKPGMGFDLSALSLGVVEKKNIILGDGIKPGDVVIGLPSSGPHSNGYTLIRRILEANKISLDSKPLKNSKTLGEILLTPTRIYVREVLKLVENRLVSGLAHITGGAFTKLMRLTKGRLGFQLSMPEPPEIFQLLQKWGNVDASEMYKTFNMGVGFCVITRPENENAVIQLCKRPGLKPVFLGYVSERRKVTLKTYTGEEISY
ncbi:MAG: phosphoribosylformylglycinamidine cyclo-ligase [Candidatus Odinarchaeum yellowstonii]|uniref:Phosphoribosylformylglycinamidine cyclo-ligase n=1 Tax=Odinarchaeota yellowstonii (strain LCB_4) TaxID=1841599 RepID=A0AAF0D272_ODILC|nr:MAG: phosphoribosylformylglycinamidine cyclo-ligase [Candidatus Odinarchaeum yellowstonii]